MSHSLSLDRWKTLIRAGLDEDQWRWDWTTLGTLGAKPRSSRAQIIAKAPGVWAAAELVDAVNDLAHEYGQKNFARSKLKNGASVKPGTVVASWSGSAQIILAFERSFLNLASYVSGVATATAELVEKARKAVPKNPPRITSTRKTLPGYRDLAVHGVCVGGGFSHRISLAAGVLIKENHIAVAGGVGAAIDGVRKLAPHGLKIETEVRSIKELREAVDAGADAVLLDNFSPVELKSALALLHKLSVRPVVEASGGIHADNIAQYALEGVDVISVGALTHSVKGLDLSLLMQGVSR